MKYIQSFYLWGVGILYFAVLCMIGRIFMHLFEVFTRPKACSKPEDPL